MSSLQPFEYAKKFEGVKLISAAAAKVPEDFIPLAFGLPATEAYNVELMAKCATKAIEAGGYKSLEYGGGAGPLKVATWIKERSKLREIFVDEQHILVTSGSGQAMDIVARGLANEGDEIWVEAPTFFGALRAFTLAGLTARGFETDEHGLKVDLVEAALKEAVEIGKKLPKFIYIIPNFHNPGGMTLSLERRIKLAQLALQYNFYILEDDAYAELKFTEDVLPAVYSFAPDRVIYMSTFSKTIAPGIRMGWVITSPELVQKLRMLKSDGSTSVMVQEIVATYLDEIDFNQHIANISSIYKARRDAMVKALHDYLGNEVSYILPEGGFFIWVSFKEDVDTASFEKIALEYGVSFIVGEYCYADHSQKNHIRLSFSYCDEVQCREAIKRIASAYFERYPIKNIV
jgi:2-aminoadipate transaminase